MDRKARLTRPAAATVAAVAAPHSTGSGGGSGTRPTPRRARPITADTPVVAGPMAPSAPRGAATNASRGGAAVARPNRAAPLPEAVHHIADETRPAHQLLTIITVLREVIADENDSLARHSTEATEALHERKTELTTRYRDTLRSVLKLRAQAAEDGQPAPISAPEAEVLKDATRRLNAAIVRNESLLKVMIDASQRVVEAFRHAAQEARTTVPTYGGGGTLNGDDRALSLSYDKLL